ncbi:tetratricopeptide repeat protein [Paraburkholderia sp. BCC1884]|uniref:tetratricopeptide repeat-containing glycosyltransferase family protein n=1 Tax=Paraburkholderia sp. BCC1884 TaxID=2562668 RepID=UPI0011829C87|nr:tetratricopeptide repeat protein [Paraburkholderia sp. BCC1884]
MSTTKHDDATADDAIVRADGYFAARRMHEAARHYQAALARRPQDVHALHRMGLVSVHLDAFDQALAYLQRALRVSPGRADLWEHAGLMAALSGHYEVAESCYLKALDLVGGTASLHRNLADCLRQRGRPVDAIAHYECALSLDPNLHHAYRILALLNTEQGDIDAALKHWLHAWTRQPAASQEDLDRIVAILRTGRSTSLEATLHEIETRFADNPLAFKAMAYVLNTSQRYQPALEAARRGLAVDPDDVLLCHHAAWSLRRLGRVAESRPYSEKAARALPHDPRMQYHLAGILLCLGEFEEGWKLQQSFYEHEEHRALMFWPGFPAWHGEPVAGCRFLLVGEQGLGDQIQFLRFAEWLHGQGAIVDVLVDRPIAVLAASMTSISAVYVDMPDGPYTYWAHMFSIPRSMRLEPSMLPIAMPYLTAALPEVRRWRTLIDAMSSRRGGLRKRRVGIVWAGSPELGLDGFRSIGLDRLTCLFSLPGISWYPLQKGPRERESETSELRFDIHTLGPFIRDFSDTLAILTSLDLLITVDSSVAHLAGAAGLPVWTLVPAYTDWRWMTERTDSPWYPSMRLFRQRELGDWAPVIAEVRRALSEWRDAPLRCMTAARPERVQSQTRRLPGSP